MLPDTPSQNTPETTLEEPVYLFTDKAIVPASRPNGAPPAGDEQAKPVLPAPDEQSGS
jgi:hypothetical protein